MSLQGTMQVMASSSGRVIEPRSAIDTAKDMVYKPAVIGATTAAAAGYLWGFRANTIGVLGKAVPWWVVLGGGAMLSSMAAEALHKWAFPHLGEAASEPVSMAVSAGANGAVLAGVLHLLNPEFVSAMGLLKVAGTGAVAQIVGDQLYERALKPTILS